jgi:hypothetical protein
MESSQRRRRVEPTDEWEQIELLCGWPEQRDYELIRPMVLFGAPADGRSQETGESSGRTLRRKATRFEAEGMESLSLTKGSGSTAQALSFSTVCRTFLSGGTRIRTGDTMIFSHMQKPLGMRKTRVGKRIYVQGVPSDTMWFCPTVALLLTGLSSLWEPPEAQRVRLLASLVH